jgi:hypothetical protein
MTKFKYLEAEIANKGHYLEECKAVPSAETPSTFRSNVISASSE